MPSGVQVAENLVRVGVLDGVVEPGTFRESAATALSVMCGPAPGPPSQAALSLLQGIYSGLLTPSTT